MMECVNRVIWDIAYCKGFNNRFKVDEFGRFIIQEKLFSTLVTRQFMTSITEQLVDELDENS